MKKKLLSILLAAVMAASLVACGEEGSNTEQQKDTQVQQKDTQEQQKDTQASVDGEIDINAAYDETVTLELAMSNRMEITYADGDDISNNPWIRSYKERFNIEVIPAFISEQADYQTKINLAIAEAKLPDVFTVSVAQFQELIEADLLCDLTEAFDMYASDTIKAYMEQESASFDSGKSEGKLYGIPQLGYGPLPQFNHIWIRKDWKEALNLDDPKTMDDVVEIAKAFMDEYGVSGIGADQNMTTLNLMANAWGAYPGIWVETEEGQIEYGSIQPEMKQALATWAEWYQDGIIDADFTTTNMEKIYEDCINGEVGVLPFYQWWGYNPGVNVVANQGADAYFEPYMIPSATREEVLHPLKCDNNYYVVVSKECENPEAVIKCLNFYTYMTDESAGVEDQEIIDAHLENQMYQAAAHLRVMSPMTEYNTYEAVRQALDNNDPSIIKTTDQEVKYSQSLDFIENGTPESVGAFLQQGSEKSAYANAKYLFDNGKYFTNKLWAVWPETLKNSGTTLEDILVEGFVKIIMGNEPIDYFDTLVEAWKQAGGEQATIEMNEIYGE